MVESRHAVLGAAIVGPGQVAAVPLPVEIIGPRDGLRRQDRERDAVGRWMQRIGPNLKDLQPVFLGDDLYACQPACKAIRAAGSNVILTPGGRATRCSLRNATPATRIQAGRV